MNHIIKIIKSFEESGLLIKGLIKTINSELSFLNIFFNRFKSVGLPHIAYFAIR